MIIKYKQQQQLHHGISEQHNPSNARYGRSFRIFEASGRDVEPHHFKADGDVVRAVQADCGIHAPGLAAFARQCGPD